MQARKSRRDQPFVSNGTLTAEMVLPEYPKPNSQAWADQHTLDIAVEHDHRALVNLLVAKGFRLAPDLYSALLRSKTAGPVFKLIRRLVEAECPVDRGVGLKINLFAQNHWIDVTCRWFGTRIIDYSRPQYVCPTDCAMTAVLLAHRLVTTARGLPATSAWVKTLLEHVVKPIDNLYIEVPSEPFPFRDMAREVLDWMKTEEIKGTERER